MAKRIIAAIAAAYPHSDEGKPAIDVVQGQEVDLSPEQEKHLEERKALVPEQFESFDEFSRYKLDAYRAGRGDAEAGGRLARFSGGIANLDAPAGGPDLIEYLRTEKPTVDDTVALAEGNPAKAEQVLAAEEAATGGEPRKGVVEGLERVKAEAADGEG